ncbi:MAG: DUF362 domain-containing protein, partial [Planctomycetota bacterium]
MPRSYCPNYIISSTQRLKAANSLRIGLSSFKLIGITPVKHHARAGASMSMKNWYGLLGGRRNIFHQDINTIIAELSMMVKPTLVILDGTEVMMTNGPTGG